MFEPENDIERLLMRASAEPAERPAFARALMDAEIFLVLVPEGGDPIIPGPDGKVVIPEGTKMILPSAMRGEERLIPFFTARSRARAWFKDDHVAVPDGPAICSTAIPARRSCSIPAPTTARSIRRARWHGCWRAIST